MITAALQERAEIYSQSTLRKNDHNDNCDRFVYSYDDNIFKLVKLSHSSKAPLPLF